MLIYHYHPETAEFLGSNEARPSPLEPGKHLIPRHATSAPPPSVDANEVAVWNGVAWTVRDDFRGTVYWTDAETSVEIDTIGDTVPAGATTTAPPTPEDDEAVLLTDGEWQVVPDLRGTVYWTADGTRVEITEINVTVPSGASLTPPPDASGIELTNLQFALACVGASLMTEQEAEDWVATGALPASATTALDTLPDDGTRAAARIRFRGARVIARTDPFISVLQSALSLTDEQVDDLFFAGADL